MLNDESYDGVFIGASDGRFLKRFLSGTVADHLFAGPQAISVGVVRRALPWKARWSRGFDRFLLNMVPQVDREERVKLSSQLETGSRLQLDYILLMSFNGDCRYGINSKQHGGGGRGDAGCALDDANYGCGPWTYSKQFAAGQRSRQKYCRRLCLSEWRGPHPGLFDTSHGIFTRITGAWPAEFA